MTYESAIARACNPDTDISVDDPISDHLLTLAINLGLERFVNPVDFGRYLIDFAYALRQLRVEIDFGDPESMKKLLQDLLAGTLWKDIPVIHEESLPAQRGNVSFGNDECFVRPRFNEEGKVELLFSTKLED